MDELFIVGGTGSRGLQVETPERKKWVFNHLLTQFEPLKDKYGDRLRIMSGGAEGFDYALARAAFRLGIKVILVLPNSTYGDYYWSPRGSITHRDRSAEFQAFLNHELVEQVIYATEHYGISGEGPWINMQDKTAGWKRGRNIQHANFIRNQLMVEMGHAFYVYDPTSRGTSHCLQLIKKAGKQWKEVPQA